MFVLAVIAGLLGFYVVLGAAAAVAKLLFALLLVLCLALFIAAVFIGGRVF